MRPCTWKITILFCWERAWTPSSLGQVSKPSAGGLFSGLLEIVSLSGFFYSHLFPRWLYFLCCCLFIQVIHVYYRKKRRLKNVLIILPSHHPVLTTINVLIDMQWQRERLREIFCSCKYGGGWCKPKVLLHFIFEKELLCFYRDSQQTLEKRKYLIDSRFDGWVGVH